MKTSEGLPGNSFGPNNYPSCLYNGMIAPLVDFPIKGVIWYQGESDSYRAYEYRTLFPNLIRDWRNKWKNPNLPFIFVQLANFRAPDSIPGTSEWAELREAQSLALKLPNTAMITAIDIGEGKNIHPKNKQEVGARLGNAALTEVYGINHDYKGPVYEKYKKIGQKIEVSFSGATGKLKVDDKWGYIYGFTIAGEDKKFYWAQARISGPYSVEVWSDKVINPIAVRYSWQDNPDPANLKNEAGLPAYPFRTDDWKLSTYDIKRF